jgi:hypothetical protein
MMMTRFLAFSTKPSLQASPPPERRARQETDLDRIEIFTREYASLWVWPTRKVVHHQIHRPLTGPQFRELLSASAETLIQYGATKRLSDDRKNRLAAPIDQQWAGKVFMPRAVGHGWKYWALLQPEALSDQIDMRAVTTRMYVNGLALRVFNDLETANAWLDAQ